MNVSKAASGGLLDTVAASNQSLAQPLAPRGQHAMDRPKSSSLGVADVQAGVHEETEGPGHCGAGQKTGQVGMLDDRRG